MADRTYINTIQWLAKKTNKTIVDVAKHYNYPDDVILVLENKEQEFREKYPEIANNIDSCVLLRDNRTPFEYAQDLASNWLIEDYYLDLVNNAARTNNIKLKIFLGGTDAKRQFLSNGKVSCKSDYFVLYNNKKTPVELMVNFTDYWSKYKSVELRCSKAKSLREHESYLLGINLLDEKFFLIKFNKDSTKGKSVVRWSKPAESFVFEDFGINFTELNHTNLLIELMKAA